MARKQTVEQPIGENVEILSQVEWTEADFSFAEAFARFLGYRQYAYTTTSQLWGFFCLPENPATAKKGQRTQHGCIVKTKELGFLFVQTPEDLGFLTE